MISRVRSQGLPSVTASRPPAAIDSPIALKPPGSRYGQPATNFPWRSTATTWACSSVHGARYRVPSAARASGYQSTPGVLQTGPLRSAFAVISLAPIPEVAIAGVALLGVSFGAFLSVDWALMTSIIPMASAGRYMGFSNIVDALNGPIASALGMFTMAAVAGIAGDTIGGRTGMFLGIFVFGMGALLLRPVREPRPGGAGRDRGGTPAAVMPGPVA